MHNPLLIKTFLANGAIVLSRIVALAATSGVVAQADDTSANLFGVSDKGATVADGGRIDVITHGFAELEYGGNVDAGDPITADADGRAVKAAPATGVQEAIIGFAVEGGTVDVIGSVRIAPSIITGQ